MVDDEIRKNVERLRRNARALELFFKDAPRGYERLAVSMSLALSTVLPLGLSYRLYHAVSLLLARNPEHRYAVETMRLDAERGREAVGGRDAR